MNSKISKESKETKSRKEVKQPKTIQQLKQPKQKKQSKPKQKNTIRNYLMENIKKEFDVLKNVVMLNKKNYVIQHEIMFPFLYQIVIAMETLFPTSVICESSFSLLKYVKTDQRNQLKTNTIDSIMRIKYSSRDELHDVVDQLIKEKHELWSSLKKNVQVDSKDDQK